MRTQRNAVWRGHGARGRGLPGGQSARSSRAQTLQPGRTAASRSTPRASARRAAHGCETKGRSLGEGSGKHHEGPAASVRSASEGLAKPAAACYARHAEKHFFTASLGRKKGPGQREAVAEGSCAQRPPVVPLTPGVAAERVAPPGSGRLGVGPRLTPPSGIVPGQVAWLSCRLSSGKGEVPTPPAAQLRDELHAAGEVFAEMTATVIITGKDRRKTEAIRNHEIRTGHVLTQQNHGTHGTWGPVSTLGRRRGAPSHAACLYKPF